MNYRIRLFQDNIIDVTNQFSDVPLEARRLVLESVMHLVERESDKAIMGERESMEAENAESIFQDKLGELPE